MDFMTRKTPASEIMFEWDAKKMTLNLKHGVSFEEAQTVFDDPFFWYFRWFIQLVKTAM
ncbi:MAG: BrnT family toxin [Blastocatellia bacterium]